MKTIHEHQHNLMQPGGKAKAPAGNVSKSDSQSVFRLAVSATVHCLIGCGIGEITGMVIASHLGFSNLESVLLSASLGLIGGLALGILPLMRHGFDFVKALKTVILGEGLSILVMLVVEILVEFSIPGVMEAHLTDIIFWVGMAAGLTAGFIAALPVNYFFIRRGVGHAHH